MLNRFEGELGKPNLLDALRRQKLADGNEEIAGQLLNLSTLKAFKSGEVLIEQNNTEDSVFLILSGSVDVIVNGRVVGRRFRDDHVGEMAAIDSSQPRSATILAHEDLVVATITSVNFAIVANGFPQIYKSIARELSRRLVQRNAFVTATHEKIRVFIISSVEALHVARAIQSAFEHEKFLTTLWTDGVFRVASYALESLENQVDNSDFAIAIAHADDIVDHRGSSWPVPRDNVIFELGLFMGRLGKSRAILMEPREEGIKLPSDLAGIVTIPYRYEQGADAHALMAPAVHKLREHIHRLGPNN